MLAHLRPKPGVVVRASGEIVPIPEAVVFQKSVEPADIPIDEDALVHDALVHGPESARKRRTTQSGNQSPWQTLWPWKITMRLT